MGLFSILEEKLVSIADSIPLELFTLVGTFVEEVIAPIPSPIVMIVSGSLAAVQQKPLEFLLILAVLGAVGKTCGAFILYIFASKAEDIVFEKFGRFLGISKTDVEKLGRHISNSKRDILVLALVRALPFIPSVVVSVGSGVLKVRLQLFLVATFLGTIVRDAIYLYFGYAGASAYSHLVNGFDRIESLIQVLSVLAVAIVVGWVYYHRRRGLARNR